MSTALWLSMFAVIALLLGGALFILGWRGRPADRLAYCRKCRFCLEGIERTACPECGRDVSGARGVRVVRRRRRKGLLAIGGVVLVLSLVGGGALVWGRLTTFNWNTVKPVWMLEMEAGSSHRGTMEGAWTELARRQGGDGIAAGVTERLVADALAIQGDPARPWSPATGDFVEAARMAERVDDARWFEYYRRGIGVSARVRARVQRGVGVPIEISVGGHRLGTTSSLVLAIGEQRLVATDGAIVARRESGVRMGLGAGGRGSTRTMFDAVIEGGEFKGALECSVSLRAGYGGEPLHGWDMEFPIDFEVLDGPTVTIDGSDLAGNDQMLRGFSVGELAVERVADGVATAYLELRAVALPMAASFDILAIVRGTEVRVGSVTFPASADQHTHGMGVQIPGFSGDQVTLILRTSAEHAEKSVDLTEVWDGEVVLEDVPVTWPTGIERPGRGVQERPEERP